MYRLLIVDDEIHAAHGIKDGVDWGRLGFSHVHVAYNARQAREILQNHAVELMICDIEMPQENGLELLSWVKAKQFDTRCIILTCHADFHYAQKALRLGSADYLLKPIRFEDLESVVQHVVGKIESDRKERQFADTLKHYYRLWLEHRPLLVERFWLDLIHQNISSRPEQLEELMRKRNIPYDRDDIFLPVLVSVRNWSKVLSERDQKILEYALRNAAEHSLEISDLETGCVVPMTEEYMIVILDKNHPLFLSDIDLRHRSAQYVEFCRKHFYCELCVYIGSPTRIPSIRETVMALIQQDMNNVKNSGIVFRTDYAQERPVLHPPALIHWIELLRRGDKTALLEDIDAYLSYMEKSECDAKLLQQFYFDFLQMIGHVLHLKGLQAHLIFADTVSPQNAVRITRSFDHMREWITQVISTGIDFIRSVEQSRSLIDRVKKYVRENVHKGLTREDIAEHVYLSPDYLSRLFRKETGQSLSDHLIEEKMNYAKQLLADSDKSVSEIAASVGYTNFSHFSKMFKKVTGMNPLEYRKCRHRKIDAYLC
ncbi:response regulator [Cohnella laeviribosi]|uniref:response regulator n=1 Tax=Cohnella laeviribosi TaxID=380174 RepID=UPI000374632D|nr:response regulator [Cohnella laeviribosi]